MLYMVKIEGRASLDWIVLITEEIYTSKIMIIIGTKSYQPMWDKLFSSVNSENNENWEDMF